MSENQPPSIDPVAAARWALLATQRQTAPWLHEEIARRMAEKLPFIRLPVTQWAHWEPQRGGMQGHELVVAQYPGAQCYLVQPHAPQGGFQASAQPTPWWKRLSRTRATVQTVAQPPEGAMQMVWANMLAHQVAHPSELLADWHKALATEGFVMFSCFGPDTLRELRSLYERLGWPAPAQDFTDMHDWGDQMVAAGFADPVMDMENITLTFPSPERLLAELRDLGRNLNVARFPGLRGRQWQAQLHAALQTQLNEPGAPQEPLALTFEVIYGHALKPAPRLRVSERTEIKLDDMRAALQQRKKPQP